MIVQHWNDIGVGGVGDTPTTADGLHIHASIDLIIGANRSCSLAVKLSTCNYSISENATGALALEPTPSNPSRGFGSPTLRASRTDVTLPDELAWTRIKCRFYNKDNPGPATHLVEEIEVAPRIALAALVA